MKPEIIYHTDSGGIKAFATLEDYFFWRSENDKAKQSADKDSSTKTHKP